MRKGWAKDGFKLGWLLVQEETSVIQTAKRKTCKSDLCMVFNVLLLRICHQEKQGQNKCRCFSLAVRRLFKGWWIYVLFFHSKLGFSPPFLRSAALSVPRRAGFLSRGLGSCFFCLILLFLVLILLFLKACESVVPKWVFSALESFPPVTLHVF